MEYRSISDLSKLIIRKISVIPNDIDLIVGIPRSGLFVANLISLLINKPLTDVSGFEENRLISTGHTKNNRGFITDCYAAKKILIIDDSVNEGTSIIECKRRIDAVKKEGMQCIYACIYLAPGKESLVDIFFEEVTSPRLFEWNIYHHSIIEHSCFDIDGVLCEDPTFDENDDGENYLRFLSNAKPKIIPSIKIGALVSARLSKYEAATRSWMKEHGVQFDELVMMDCSFEERRKLGNHASFKGNFYKKSNYKLFFESDPFQAQEINRISKKPVFCVENGFLFDGSTIYKIRKEKGFKQRIVRFAKKSALGRFALKVYRVLKKAK